jgi:hypothetical protein
MRAVCKEQERRAVSCDRGVRDLHHNSCIVIDIYNYESVFTRHSFVKVQARYGIPDTSGIGGKHARLW